MLLGTTGVRRRPVPEDTFKPFSYNLERLFEQQWPLYVNRYQRDYAWETDEIADFVNDLRNLVSRRKTKNDFAHFFGAVVSVKRERDAFGRPEYEVVDGQQRLATFSLLQAALIRGAGALTERLSGEDKDGVESFISKHREVYVEQREWNKVTKKNEDRRMLRVVERDDSTFRALMDDEDPPAVDSHSEQLLIDAEETLYDLLVAPIIGETDAVQAFEDLTDFARQVEEGSEFIFIQTSSPEHANQLFSVLNDRGRRLTEADLLRAHTLMLVSSTDRDDDESIKAQTRIADALDSIDVLPPTTVDAFLRHYFASVFGERLPAKRISREYRSRFLDNAEEPVEPMDRQSVVDTVEGFAEAANLFDPISRGLWPFGGSKSGPASAVDWDHDRLLRVVRTLQSDRVLPVLLSAAQQGEDYFREIVLALEPMEFRAIASGEEQNRMAKLFFDVAALIRAGTMTSEQAIHEMWSWIARWSDNEKFERGLGSRLIYGGKGTNYIKHLLTTIEDHIDWLDDGHQGTPQAAKMQVWDMNLVEDEHIYPQNPKDGVPPELLDHVNRLGNQTFLAPKDNKAKEFSNRLPSDPDKINAYIRKAQPKLTKRVGTDLQKKPVWGKDQIDTREAELIEDAKAVFAPPPDAASRASTLPASRPQLFQWRAPGDRRIWLVGSSPTSKYKNVPGVHYEYPSKIPNGKQIAAGDEIIVFNTQQAGNKKAGIPKLPARIVERATIDHLLFLDGGTMRHAVYDKGSLQVVQDIPIVDPNGGTDPRVPKRNAITRVSEEYLDELRAMI